MAFDQFVFIGSVDLCLIKVLLFHPSAAASGDMIMASLLDLGADLQAVRKAVESVGWRLEVSRQERSSIMARRAAVTSDRSFQSSRRCANKKALKNAVRVLHIWPGRRAGAWRSCGPLPRGGGAGPRPGAVSELMRRRCRGASIVGENIHISATRE